MLKDLLQRQVDCFAEECDEWLDAAANARLVKDAEAYYRVMYYGSAESWNLRDTHMFEPLCQRAAWTSRPSMASGRRPRLTRRALT